MSTNQFLCDQIDDASGAIMAALLEVGTNVTLQPLLLEAQRAINRAAQALDESNG